MKKLLPVVAVLVLSVLCADKMRAQASGPFAQLQETMTTDNKITVEIWSDVMCPWCYIGKRRFEKALSDFDDKASVEVVWKSFQLNPNMKTEPGKNISQYLAEVKGWTLEHAQKMNAHVTGIAAKEGLEYNMDKAVVANSFDAHRIVQLAKTKGKGDAMEERLFRAYFTEGLNTADHVVLVRLATEIGLDESEVKEVLASSMFAENVHQDVREAQTLGASGVPFFVINRKYGVSGAQESEAFLQVLEKASQDMKANSLEMLDGKACTPDGECD